MNPCGNKIPHHGRSLRQMGQWGNGLIVCWLHRNLSHTQSLPRSSTQWFPSLSLQSPALPERPQRLSLGSFHSRWNDIDLFYFDLCQPKFFGDICVPVCSRILDFERWDRETHKRFWAQLLPRLLNIHYTSHTTNIKSESWSSSTSDISDAMTVCWLWLRRGSWGIMCFNGLTTSAHIKLSSKRTLDWLTYWVVCIMSTKSNSWESCQVAFHNWNSQWSQVSILYQNIEALYTCPHILVHFSCGTKSQLVSFSLDLKNCIHFSAQFTWILCLIWWNLTCTGQVNDTCPVGSTLSWSAEFKHRNISANAVHVCGD
jgi:hypothetical protein